MTTVAHRLIQWLRRWRAPEPQAPEPVRELRRRLDQALEALDALDTLAVRDPAPPWWRRLLAGFRPRRRLPWHLLLGPSGAGKSSLLVRPGIAEAALPDSNDAGPPPTGTPEVRPAAPGVLLDTPGRWLEPAADRTEWLELLRHLRRRRVALDGVVAVLALDQLDRPDSAGLALGLRRRLAELSAILGIRPPLYLLLTKADLLPGFPAWSGRLTEPAGAWGAALPEHAGPGAAPAEAVAEAFEQLCRGLEGLNTDPFRCAAGDALLALEFRALGPALRRFCAALAEADPAAPPPFLRGFYFASARQGPPVPTAADRRIAEAFGLAPPPVPAPAPDPGPPRFLDGLFREVIFSDRRLTRRVPPRRQPVLLAVGMAAAALLALTWTLSFLDNLALVRAAEAVTRQVEALDGGDLPDQLRGLGLLAPWIGGGPLPGPAPILRRGLGLHQGPRIQRELRRRFGRLLQPALLEPVRRQLERELATGAERRAPLRPAERQLLLDDLRACQLLADPARAESGHLAAHLPRLWRPWLEAALGPAPDPELQAAAEAALDAYLAWAPAPDRPCIQALTELAGRVRDRLDGGAAASPLEHAYGAIRARADGRYPALALDRLLAPEDLALFRPARTVPGGLTREAWDGEVRAALERADLDRPAPADPAAAERAGLEALHFSACAQAWAQFLESLALRPSAGPLEAAAVLGRLGDAGTSPLKRILDGAAWQTDLDRRPDWRRSLQNATDRVRERTGSLLGAAASPGPPAPPGPAGPEPSLLGRQAAFLATLTTPAGGGPSSLDGYLALLRKIRGRMLALAAAPDPDGACRQLAQATLAGGSELAEGLQWLEALPGDPRQRAFLRPLLLAPLSQGYAALLAGAERDLERLWEQQVAGSWRALAEQYPFRADGADADLAELLRFLRPREGTLDRFIDQHLGVLVADRAAAPTVRPWAGVRLVFHPGALERLGRLRAAAALLGDGACARFELRPVPTPGLAEIQLELDGQRLHYRNGPQLWTGFTWPGPEPASGARLQALDLAGAPVLARSAPGRMGLARLLDQARTGGLDSGACRLEWPLPSGKVVAFDFRPVSGCNPLRLAALRGCEPPARLTR